MNQEQRKFLIERVNKTFQNQSNKITAKKLERPSLNNYLVAACLDDSIQFASLDKLRKKIKEAVLRYGPDDKLVHENSRTWNSKEKDRTVSVSPEDLFVIPEAYKKAFAEYQHEAEIQKRRLEELEAQRDTIILKIQIGSNQVLDKLIGQADNLADLNIMNSQLLLGDGNQTK